MLKGAAKCAGVLAIALAGFFATRALTDRLDDEPTATEPTRPKIYGVAGAPAPEPPAWPAVKKDMTDAAADQGEDSRGGTPVAPTTASPSEGTETAPPPDEDPPPPDPGGSNQEKGSSGSGIEEEVGG